MIIDLNRVFPPGADGTCSPLPKQQQFLDAALDPNGAQFIAYVGGVGSGKTLIGCATVLTWAVSATTPADFLICRQFSPEMLVTTQKTFVDMVPKEVLIEYRVADKIVRIRNAGGHVSNVIFRPAEEPDKLRSLNLSGVYLDEASQISEAAFLLFQTRLRGPGLRKLILTSNPAGHDWIYKNWVKQDHFNNPAHKRRFRLIKAPSTENTHLPDGYVASMLDSFSKERVEREIMGSFDSFEGQVYHEFRRDVHVIKPFKIPDTWTCFVGHDAGFRNPTAVLWGAVDYDGNVYIYREFYRREWLISEICTGNPRTGEKGIVALTGNERIEQARIDPSTRARDGRTGESDWDEYQRHLPRTWPLLPANNDVELGIDRVKSYLKINERTGKPRVFFFDTCTETLEEISTYKYKELGANQQGKMNEKEEPVKVNDHAMDALRYLLMSQPEAPKAEDKRKALLMADGCEGSLRRELEKHKNPPKADPFGDY